MKDGGQSFTWQRTLKKNILVQFCFDELLQIGMKVLRQAQQLIFTYQSAATDAVVHYRGSLWFRKKK